jgi:hypothetical protein
VLCEVGNNVDVRVAVIFGHGDQIRYFNTHPHEENWPFPTNDPTNDPTSDLVNDTPIIQIMCMLLAD